MEKQKLRSFRKLLRLFERLTVNQIKEDSCCQGVTLGQCHTILEIEDLGKATIVELAKRIGLDKSTLSRTIDGLVNVGLVERVAHPSDRRFNLLSLTANGQEVADQINQSNDDFYNRVFESIEDASHEATIDHFEKLVTAMRRQQKHSNVN
ncbi:MAG: MarR family winged helix-turn-helix transcriptional regulator [Desulfobacterales bacterium]|jgi:DNA-binding MarR family transcriptional regulator